MAKTNYHAAQILDAYLNGATVYAGLLTAVTDEDAGTVTEVSGGNYAREAMSFGAASGKTASNDSQVSFAQADQDQGTVSHLGIFDALSAGNLLYIVTLDSSFDYDTNVQPVFDSGSVDVTED